MYPDFVCIGAPKGGTTWLFDNLKRHPQIWLPPLKSVQYFSGRANWKRFKKLAREYNRVLNPRSLAEVAWFVRYFLSPIVNEQWYSSLFPSQIGKITGEIAPAYTACDQDTVKRIGKLMPEVRIIFIMRNPIDRAWSHAVLGLAKNRSRAVELVPEHEFIKALSGDLSTLKSSYIRTLKNWRTVFPEKQIMIRFFEEIAEHPYDLLYDVCKFLGVNYNPDWFSKSAERNIFKGVGGKIPPQIGYFLAERYIEDICQLQAEFGGYTNIWLENANQLLNQQIDPVQIKYD